MTERLFPEFGDGQVAGWVPVIWGSDLLQTPSLLGRAGSWPLQTPVPSSLVYWLPIGHIQKESGRKREVKIFLPVPLFHASAAQLSLLCTSAPAVVRTSGSHLDTMTPLLHVVSAVGVIMASCDCSSLGSLTFLSSFSAFLTSLEQGSHRKFLQLSDIVWVLFFWTDPSW